MNQSDDILISAYLDGELNADERARVEQLLATSAEARQLLDELRALRAGLQDLPQHRLELDFAQRVLAQAEREAAEQKSIPHSPLPIPHSTSPNSALQIPRSESPAPTSSRLPINRRGITWSLVAVAAALLIMVANRESQQNREIADNVSLSSNRGVPPTSTPMLVEAPKQPASVHDAQEKEELNQSPAAIPPADHIAASDREFHAPAGASSASSTPLGSNDRSRLDQSVDLPAAAAPATSLADAKQDFSKNLNGDRRSPASMAGQLPASTGLMLVDVEISPEAVERHDFDQLLAKNHITLAANQSPSTAANKTLSESNNLTLSGQGSAAPVMRAAKPATALDQKSDSSSTVSASDDLSRNQPADVVLVEATPEQIQHVLADLRQAPHLFASVAVASAALDNLKPNSTYSQYYKRLPSKADKDLQTDSAANSFASGSVQSRSAEIATDEKKSVVNQPANQTETGRTETITATPLAKSENAAERSLQKRAPETGQFGVANSQVPGQPVTPPQPSLGSANDVHLQENLPGVSAVSESTPAEGRAKRLLLSPQTNQFSFDKQNLSSGKMAGTEAAPITAGTLSGGTLNSQPTPSSPAVTAFGGGGFGGQGGGGFHGGVGGAGLRDGGTFGSASDKVAPDKLATPSVTPAPTPAMPATQPSGTEASSTLISAPTQRVLFIFRLGNTSENPPTNSIKK